jgi:hypothetical protein
VRQIQHFFSLKPTGTDLSEKTSRIVIIENAHTMTNEAQNALLKAIEEPPAGAVLLLSTISAQALLPTIRSRVQELTITPPTKAEQIAALKAQGYEDAAIQQALALSGELPGLTRALLDEDTEHPLRQAVDWSRTLLGATRFERLTLVDELAKQKELAGDICTVLSRMARTALKNPSLSSTQSQRWLNVLETAEKASDALRGHGQPKLILDSLSLHL